VGRYSHLPPSIKFDSSKYPDKELTFYLQARFDDWRECISRPFLYNYLHADRDQQHPPSIIDISQREVELCSNAILRNMHHQRHGGTWFIARNSFRSAVLILAVAVRNGDVRPPGNWRELVRLALMTLERWCSGVEDLVRMKGVLERLFEAVCERVGRGGRRGTGDMFLF
jgi:hypothetical protein